VRIGLPVLSSIAIALSLCASLGLNLFQEVIVYESGSEGYNTFRIPAIIKAPNNDLLAFAEARIDGVSDYGNQNIVMKRSTDNGLSWTTLQVVVDHNRFTHLFTGNTVFCGNVSPVVDESNGTIWLPFSIIGNYISDAAGIYTIWATNSKDNGRTWAVPVEITRLSEASGLDA